MPLTTSGRGEIDVEQSAEETTPLLSGRQRDQARPQQRPRSDTRNADVDADAGPTLRRPAPYAASSASDRAKPSAGATSGVLSRWTRALAALRTGHLPSSEQFVKLCDTMLESDTLAVEPRGTVWQGPDLGRGRIGTGRLSEKGERVRLATRRAALAHRDLLARRNRDLPTGTAPGDAWQELWYAWKQGELATAESPSPEETSDVATEADHDPPTQSVRSALFTLVRLIVTSASLRQLVADLVLLLRDLVQLQLGQRDLQPAVKEKLEQAVETVVERTVGQDRVQEHDLAAEEQQARPTTSLHQASSMDTRDGQRPVLLPEQDADDLRGRILDRLRQIIAELQRTKAYQQAMECLLAALRTRLFSLLDKSDPSATALATAAADSHPSGQNPLGVGVLLVRPFVEDADPELARALGDWADRLRTALGGPEAVEARCGAPDAGAPTPPFESMKAFVGQADEFITSILLKPHYLGSNESYRALGVLTETVEGFERDAPVWVSDVRRLVREAISSLLCVANDPILGEAVAASAEIVEASGAWLGTAGLMVGKAASGGILGIGDAVWGDVVEWIVPRVLGVLSEASLPRLEFAMPNVAVALEPPSVISTSFIPARISLHQSSLLSYTPPSSLATLAVPLSASVPAAAENPDSRTHFKTTNVLSVEGIQLEVLNVGYFASYKTGIPCFGDVTERGLLDLHFGVDDDATTTDPSLNAAEGLAFDLTFHTPTSTSSDDDDPPLFQVDHSRTSVRLRDFRLEPHQSSHPWLMWFFRPLLRKAVQTVIEHELKEKVIEGGAEWIARIGGEVRGRRTVIEAEEESTTSGMWSWVRSIWDVLGSSGRTDRGQEDGSPAQQQLRQVASPSSDAASEASAVHVHLTSQGITVDLDDFEATVGLGSKGVVLPAGEAEVPLPEGEQPKKGVARAARDEVEREVRQGKAAARAGMGMIGSAVEARQQWREEVAGDGLAGQTGWRSDAFEV